jgi:RNA polymerase sigma-70 factor (ECF subfamily)
VGERGCAEDFERLILPHLDAAYNLARWLLRGSDEARDVTQETMLRAFKYFDGFHGDNAKAWLLQIVRNSCYRWIKERPTAESMSPDDEGNLNPEHERALLESGYGLPAPDARLIEEAERRPVQESLQVLPTVFREILILREIEELSYREISDITGIPMGTVMSRLSRARALLLQQLSDRASYESNGSGVIEPLAEIPSPVAVSKAAEASDHNFGFRNVALRRQISQ